VTLVPCATAAVQLVDSEVPVFAVVAKAVGASIVTAGADVTTADGPERAEFEPEAFVAVTTTRSVRPTSDPATAYVADRAPLMERQLDDFEPVQLCH
jgi:hypothetical protein